MPSIPAQRWQISKKKAVMHPRGGSIPFGLPRWGNGSGRCRQQRRAIGAHAVTTGTSDSKGSEDSKSSESDDSSTRTAAGPMS